MLTQDQAEEALTAGRLGYPNAVQLFDVGEDAGRHYIVMEFVDGSDVRAVIADGPRAPHVVGQYGTWPPKPP